MLHIFCAERVASQATEDDHTYERWDRNFSHAGLDIDWADFTTLEVDAFHQYLDNDASDCSHESHYK